MSSLQICLSIVFLLLAHTLGVLSGYAKMICDLSEEGKLNKKPFDYWHKALSSKNKNQYTGKIKLWLKRNLFVSSTDAWHKYQLILTVCLIGSGFFIGFVAGMVTPYYSFFLLSLYIARTGTFHLLYKSKKYRI